MSFFNWVYRFKKLDKAFWEEWANSTASDYTSEKATDWAEGADVYYAGTVSKAYLRDILGEFAVGWDYKRASYIVSAEPQPKLVRQNRCMEAVCWRPGVRIHTTPKSLKAAYKPSKGAGV